MKPYDAYEIHGVAEVGGGCEPVPDGEAEFWSLYGHVPGEGSSASATSPAGPTPRRCATASPAGATSRSWWPPSTTCSRRPWTGTGSAASA